MATSAALINNIIEVEQLVADFLVTPGSFTPAQAAALITTVEGLRGGVQALPINAVLKADLNHRLDTVEAILNGFARGTSGVEDVDVLNSVLTSLTLLKQKIMALNVPMSCGMLSVDFPCAFSTNFTCQCH